MSDAEAKPAPAEPETSETVTAEVAAAVDETKPHHVNPPEPPPVFDPGPPPDLARVFETLHAILAAGHRVALSASPAGHLQRPDGTLGLEYTIEVTSPPDHRGVVHDVTHPVRAQDHLGIEEGAPSFARAVLASASQLRERAEAQIEHHRRLVAKL